MVMFGPMEIIVMLMCVAVVGVAIVLAVVIPMMTRSSQQKSHFVSAREQELEEENERLRDEIARLKGEESDNTQFKAEE